MSEAETMVIPAGTVDPATLSEPGEIVHVAPLPPELPADWQPETFAELLQALSSFGIAMTPVKLDPEKLVGDLRGKVDAIKYVLDRMEAEEKLCREQAKPWNKAATALKKNHERLKDYVEYWMKREGFEELPGNTRRAFLKNEAERLEMLKGAPDVFDYQRYPDYVKPVRGYAWDHEKIEADLKSGKLVFPPPAEGEEPRPPFAKLVRGQHVEFPIKKPPMLEKASKRKAKAK